MVRRRPLPTRAAPASLPRSCPPAGRLLTDGTRIETEEALGGRPSPQEEGAREAKRAGAAGGRLRAPLAAELRAQQLVDEPRVRLALRLLHHLADEEAEQALLAAPVRLDL